MKLTKEHASFLLSIVLKYRMKPMTCEEYNKLRHYVRTVGRMNKDLEVYVEVKYDHFPDGAPRATIINFWDKEHGIAEIGFNFEWTYNGLSFRD